VDPLRRIGRSIIAFAAHVHDAGQNLFGARDVLHIQRDRTEAANLVLGRDGAPLPRRGRTSAAVIRQHQPLAFAILKWEREAAIDFDHVAGDAAGLPQPVAPKPETAFAGDAQAGP
jgi:hypothetical protein